MNKMKKYCIVIFVLPLFFTKCVISSQMNEDKEKSDIFDVSSLKPELVEYIELHEKSDFHHISDSLVIDSILTQLDGAILQYVKFASSSYIELYNQDSMRLTKIFINGKVFKIDGYVYKMKSYDD